LTRLFSSVSKSIPQASSSGKQHFKLPTAYEVPSESKVGREDINTRY